MLEAAQSRHEAVVGGPRRGERHLLLEDQENERGEARRPGPELGQPMTLDDDGEVGIAVSSAAAAANSSVEHAANATCCCWLWSVAMTRVLSRFLSSSGPLALGLLLLPR